MLFTILLCVFVIGIILVPLFSGQIDWDTVQLRAGVLTGALFILSVIATWKVKLQDAEKEALEGVLHGDGEGPEGEKIIFRIGNSELMYDKAELQSGWVRPALFTNGQAPPLAISLRNDSLLVSGTFESLDSNIVAEIVANEWQINPNNYFRRNYNMNAFEVTDKSGFLKFQIEFKNKKEIVFNGFYKNGDHYYISSAGAPLKIVAASTIKKRADIRKLSDELPMLFKYPEKKYFGDRASRKTN